MTKTISTRTQRSPPRFEQLQLVSASFPLLAPMDDRKRKSEALESSDNNNSQSNNNNNNNNQASGKEEEILEEDEFSIEALSKLPIQEIKAQLDERNINYTGVVEKPELVGLLRKQIEQDLKEGNFLSEGDSNN